MNTKNIVLSLFTCFIMSCSSTKKTNVVSQDNSITEKYWKLISLEGRTVVMKDNQEREIFFTLKTKDNRITGFTGCNDISGEYTLEASNRIQFKNVVTTMRYCTDLAVNESKVLKVFTLADNYTIKDDVLSLNVGRRAPLAVFEAVYF